MFERYTEVARRSIFFARYEASQAGSPYIETEHLLLGILYADESITARLGAAHATRESLRQEILTHIPTGKKTTVSVDLPISKECRRVLDFAKDAAHELKQDHITLEHLLLGLLRLETSFAANLLKKEGITVNKIREQALSSGIAGAGPVAAEPAATPFPSSARDLTRAARSGSLSPLIGRERELDRAIQILSRRTRNNLVLVGEPGVGKSAIVEGLAQRLADGNVPPDLADRRVLCVDASSLMAKESLREAVELPGSILCIEGLFDLATAANGWTALDAIHILEPLLHRAGFRCIATGTPAGFRRTTETAAVLARHFEPVYVMAPNDEEATRVVLALKEQYERFHGITIDHDAVALAIRASRRFLPNRQLPDGALDLIDEAGALLKLRRESEPRKITEIRRRIRQAVRKMENAIAEHKFDEAREFSDAERVDREQLLLLLEERKAAGSAGDTLTAADIEQVIADRTGAPMSAIQTVLGQTEAGDFERIARELGAQLPVELREWVAFLSAWLANCSADDAERLASTIRALKVRK
jgi:ATP-dependent Clp protease ATP-binding subunit ClpC